MGIFLGMGQQPSQYSLFMGNKYGFNPAYAGMEGMLTGNAMYRTQWSGIGNNPALRTINVHSPFYRLNGGVGLSFEHADAGAHRHLQFSMSYNYVQIFGDDLIVSAGIGAGLTQRGLDGRALRTPNGIYEGNVIIHDDPRLPTTMVTGLAPNFQTGIYIAYDSWEFGIGATNILNNTITLEAEVPGGYQMQRTFFINAEHDFMYDQDWRITSGILAKTDFIQLQIDFGAQVNYKNNFSGGLAFRGYNRTSFDALVLFGGVRLNQNFYLTYAYDATLSGLNNISTGSHEIMVTYRLGRALGVGIPQRIIYHPRML
jgi:type IX secretion system PorP/SprF family membrane protein